MNGGPISITSEPQAQAIPAELYAAMVTAAATRAQIRAMAMRVDNESAERAGRAPDWDANDFRALIFEEGLDRVEKP